MSTLTVHIRRKGVITLPVELRNRYGLDEGDVFTLEDLGDGSFLLIPRVSQVAHLGDRVAELMEEAPKRYSRRWKTIFELDADYRDLRSDTSISGVR